MIPKSFRQAEIARFARKPGHQETIHYLYCFRWMGDFPGKQ
jgi:hypothetical protein